jgi:type VI secretion system secreted protein VgrG
VAEYTQANRLLSVSTELGPDALMLTELSGVEGVSMPFSLQLGFVSDDPQVQASDLLRTPVVVTFFTEDGSERKLHGLIKSFSQLGQQDYLTMYQAEMVPWLWFLTLSRDCKIFQEVTVLEILEKVFKSQGYSDFEIRCTRSYAKREYCVQYRETHFEFVSRLMEEEGIFYFFEHSDSKHLLVVADNNSSMRPCPNGGTARMGNGTIAERDVISTFIAEHAIRPAKITLNNYDFLQPSLGLLSTIAGDGQEEVYDYPGGHTTPEDGDKIVRLRLEAEEALAQVVRGSSDCRNLQSGSRFKLENHYRSDLNQPYVLLQVRHVAKAEDYRSWGSENARYDNSFLAIPADVPYRPLCNTPRPLVHGSQTARVVGMAGEEIWVDPHGRVKVQFHWDRVGEKNEHSSCWVRVATGWAGKTWGAVSIPRIGQEVVVQFLEGDPDRPIIVGSVYNAEQQPPFPLPDKKTVSGLRSRSSLGGNAANFNEISMEDVAGSEMLYIHAEKDQTIVVEHDRSDSVGNDQTISVGNDETTGIGGNRSETVDKNETITIHGSRTETVDKDEMITVEGGRTESVGTNEKITIGGNRTESVGKNETVDVDGSRSVKITKQENLTVGQGRITKVAKDDKLSAGKKLLIDAGDEIQIKTGSASITMKKDGTIAIKGKDITITGSGKITMKASSDLTLKGSQIKEN